MIKIKEWWNNIMTSIFKRKKINTANYVFKYDSKGKPIMKKKQ